MLTFWEKEIQQLSVFKDKAKHIKYNLKEKNELEKQQERILGRQHEIGVKLSSVQEKMKIIERKANDILRLTEHLNCETKTDLDIISKEVTNFIQETQNNRLNVLDALTIFEDIELEEKNKVTSLFGKDSQVSVFQRDN